MLSRVGIEPRSKTRSQVFPIVWVWWSSGSSSEWSGRCYSPIFWALCWHWPLVQVSFYFLTFYGVLYPLMRICSPHMRTVRTPSDQATKITCLRTYWARRFWMLFLSRSFLQLLFLINTPFWVSLVSIFCTYLRLALNFYVLWRSDLGTLPWPVRGLSLWIQA